MNVEIITIGDELLIGQVTDTNSGWMGLELNKAGFWVKYRTAVGDVAADMIEAFDIAKNRADIVLITGGLGPTKDDLTKDVLCKYFNCGLRFDEQAYHDIEELFNARNRTVTEINRQQAYVPEICRTIYNKNGTAPGMWFEVNHKYFVSMPGVPYEMQAMMTEDVIPELKKRFKTPAIVHRTVLTQGIGESFLSELISDFESQLPPFIKLAYLPAIGSVRLRLTGRSEFPNLENIVEKEVEKLLPLIQQYVFGYDEDKIESVIGKLLLDKNKTIATAESCTGGYISHCLTSIPGSSAYFIGSVIAYDNAVKTEVLNVKTESLITYGAVSEQVAIEMAENVKKLMKADYSIATTGIAGPAGGSAEKPVGTVWIAVSGPDFTIAKKFNLGRDRLRIIQAAASTSLNMLRKSILK